MSKFTYGRRKRNLGDRPGVILANHQQLARESLLTAVDVLHLESRVKLCIYMGQGQKLAVKSVEHHHSQMDM